MDERPKAVVAGSFEKFKPQIDLVIEELEDNGIEVIAPERGPLFIVRGQPGFHPLRSELYHPIKVVEDNFLANISKASFHYVANFEGWIGNSMAFEMGWAKACGKPIYLKEPPNKLLDLEGVFKRVVRSLEIKSPTEVAKLALAGELKFLGV